MKKVMVIGLDGFEPTIAESMMGSGALPNLASLARMGGYTRIRTTYPAQTPVAWSTFTTGTNPGGHGIFDFLARDPNTYLPMLALNRYEQKSAFLPPRVVNQRRGEPVWQLLTEASLPSTVIRCPCTYPPDEIKGRQLAGVGVPDLRGGLGTSIFYSTASELQAQHSEKVVPVTLQGDSISTHLIGPRNPRSGADLLMDLKIQVQPEARKVVISSGGKPSRLEVSEGQWSKWLRVKFNLGLLQSIKGMLRFNLVRTHPDFSLYASPINFDPGSPLFPISHPSEYAAELMQRLGPYHTAGMAEDHDGVNNGRFGDESYLEQCAGVMREREAMMTAELDRFQEGLFFCLFDTPDRLAHIFWRYREPEHPANVHAASSGLHNAIEEHYKDCDRVVGKAMQYADDETLVVVLSDHGMNSFQRGFHLNTWLMENGFLQLKAGIKPGEETAEFFHGVDWDRTQAYSLGLGGIYLNLKDREANGVVSPEQAGNVKDHIIKGLNGLVDAERNAKAVRNVVSREQVYSGPYLEEAPDLWVNFAPGYRVSWGTPLGGIPAGLFEDNRKKWGGDHVIDPSLTPGVLFMNRPFEAYNADLVDMAPTILAALGVPKGAAMEGRSLIP